ncbi:hypothetical protein BE11_10205 [Sorangium cellulosum]|nr:hypothetical protein BE11_10205 [Sorangium cellulosum]
MEMPTMKPGSRTYAGRLCTGACLALLAVTVGCGGSVIGEDDTGTPIGEDDTGTPIGEDDTGTPIGEDDTGTPIGEDDTGTPIGEDDTGTPIGEDDTGTPIGEDDTGTPIGEDDTGTPIGEDDTGTPIGEDDTGTPIGEDDTGTPIGEDDTGTPIGEDDTGTPIGEDDTGTPIGEDDTGTESPSDAGAWPKTVTLAVQSIGEAGEHVRLSDGTVSDAGDLGAHMSRLTYLRSPVEGSLCEMGASFARLADIPTDVAACSEWASLAYLSALSIHESSESYRIGLGLLVWDAEHTALYRLRVLGDSYDVAAGSTATFEYEPVR